MGGRAQFQYPNNTDYIKYIYYSYYRTINYLYYCA